MVKAERMFKRIIDICIAGMVLCILCIHILNFIGVESYIVRSGSMEPTIMTGSLCLVNTRYDYEKVMVDDVIAFELGNVLVTHRVVQITDDGFITKGDHNDLSDGLTTNEKNYVGKSLISFPYMGYVFYWFQTRKGKIICITLVLSIILFNFILSEKEKIIA